MTNRHIVAMGGGGFLAEPEARVLNDFVLSLANRRRPRVCFVPTASGDAADSIRRFQDTFTGRTEATWLPLFVRDDRDLRTFLLGQDVIYVGGGNTANMLAIWRLHDVDRILRDAWEGGVVLAGASAGSLCWFEGGVTDSFGALGPLRDGLGLLRGSHCPHYDSDLRRRPIYQALVGEGFLSGIAADDDAGLHFVDTELAEVVTSRREACAYKVELVDGQVVETAIPTQFLGEH